MKLTINKFKSFNFKPISITLFFGCVLALTLVGCSSSVEKFNLDKESSKLNPTEVKEILLSNGFILELDINDDNSEIYTNSNENISSIGRKFFTFADGTALIVTSTDATISNGPCSYRLSNETFSIKSDEKCSNEELKLAKESVKTIQTWLSSLGINFNDFLEFAREDY